jgi:hypothetical protein
MLALLRNGWVGICTSFGLLFCGELLFFLQIDNDRTGGNRFQGLDLDLDLPVWRNAGQGGDW